MFTLCVSHPWLVRPPMKSQTQQIPTVHFSLFSMCIEHPEPGSSLFAWTRRHEITTGYCGMGLLVALEGVQVEGAPCTETTMVGLLGVGFPDVWITSPQWSGGGKPTPYHRAGPSSGWPGALFNGLEFFIGLGLLSQSGQFIRVRVGRLLQGRKELRHLPHTAVKHIRQLLPSFGLLQLSSSYFPDRWEIEKDHLIHYRHWVYLI